ncbi:cobalt transporter subunit CbtA [Amorphus suaedae]
MSIFRPIVFTAVLAGLLVGLAVTVVQHFGTVPLILAAEVYENGGEAAHDHGAAGSDHGAAPAETEAAAHHEPAFWAPADGLERTAYTTLFNVITQVGFGLLLTAGLVLSRRAITWREGFLWGLAGFVIFSWAPALGLPPELPGMPAAELGARQAWWIGTVVATAVSLGLIAFVRSPLAAAAAVVLFAVPHLIGAPMLAEMETAVPEALEHRFVVAALMTTLLSWSLLGGLVGALFHRFAAGETADGIAHA